MKGLMVVTALVCAALLSCASAGKPQKAPVAANPGPAMEEPAVVEEKAPASYAVAPTAAEFAMAASAVEGAVSLDAALEDFSDYLAGRHLPDDSLTAVAAINTPAEKLGTYVVDKLSDLLLNNADLRMVSRQDVEQVLAEQYVQAGSFDDETTAKMGYNLGWKTIIFGGVEPLSEAYHLSLRAVDVETGELRGSRTYVLAGSDPILLNLVNPNVSMQRLAERETILVPFDGNENDFELSISTNKTVYYDQEFMYISLLSNADCHFVVYHLDVDNKMQLIFPNSWERDTNYLKAGVERVIPENAAYLLHEPYGEERILVYASDRPIHIPEDQYQARSINKEYLEAPEAIWRGGDGTRALTVKPRGATRQVIYSILPN